LLIPENILFLSTYGKPAKGLFQMYLAGNAGNLCKHQFQKQQR
jgi:hypothetical protein